MRRGGRIVRRRHVLVCGGVSAASLLAACGSSGSARRRTAATPAPQPIPDTVPRSGGVLRVRGASTPPLDPHASATAAGQRLAGALYSRLLRFEAGADAAVSADHRVEPDLAEAWEHTPDGLQLTLRLRANARWHLVPPVSGRAVVAEDVRFSFERFQSQPQNPNRHAFGSAAQPLIERIETPDERTVVLHLARPHAPLLALLASSQYLWLLPREAGSSYDPARTAIGSGPFMLDVVEPEVRVRVRRNPDYFLAGRPYIGAMERLSIKDEAQERARFQAGELDLASVVADARPEMERLVPGARLLPYVPSTYTYLAPQLRAGSPWRDERARRALSLALDRKAWLDLMYPGTTGRYQGVVPASLGRWWLDPLGPSMGEAAKAFRHDPRKARALLAAAGLEQTPLRFIYPANGYGEKFRQGAEATIAMLREAGFTVEPVAQDYLREFIAPHGPFSGNYDGALYSLQPAYPDPHEYLHGLYHSTSRRNHAGVRDPEADRLIDLQAGVLHEHERLARVHEAQRYLAGKLYYIPLAVGETFIAVQPWVQGYRLVPTAAAATESYAELWLTRA